MASFIIRFLMVHELLRQSAQLILHFCGKLVTRPREIRLDGGIIKHCILEKTGLNKTGSQSALRD